MKQNKFDIVFHTPAFLGDAQQSGCWRTPPFKAQLRQWWRVVYWAKHHTNFSLETMRQAEGQLFGNAWLKDDFQKSQVRMRLNHWRKGTLEQKDWEPGAQVVHPEVSKPIDSQLYLGFGPVTNKTGIKANAAIQAGESAKLIMAYPEKDAEDIEQALQLMHFYGTVGGRSRNSWGSYSCLAVNPSEQTLALPVSKDWENCLNQDWPHAIGKDHNGPLGTSDQLPHLPATN
ncbi:MAG: hypothetical protein HC848_03940 [Limnobacter sp.]|nr:hypothetical protein [Limnobacter sp.]